MPDTTRQRRECRFCGSTHTSVQHIKGGGAYAYVQCANGECGASGPVRSTPGGAINAWNAPLHRSSFTGEFVLSTASDARSD